MDIKAKAAGGVSINFLLYNESFYGHVQFTEKKEDVFSTHNSQDHSPGCAKKKNSFYCYPLARLTVNITAQVAFIINSY